MITQSIKLNLIPGDVPKHIEVSQYDTDSRTLSFTLYNGAVAFTTAGVTAQIRGTKPDKKGFEYTATYNAGVVTADVTEQMTACAGEVICELQLSKDGQILGTANFILDVERAALGEDTDISETELPDIIDGARTQAANAAESAEDAAESAAIATQAASGVYLGINMGKVVTVTSGVADTDIDLERMPKPGERILLVFEEERTGVTNIKTYLDGAGITIPIGTGEPSQKYLGQYVFECASGTQPESRLWNMVTKDYGGLPTPFATSVGGTGNTAGYIRTGREGSSTVGTAATIEGTHNQAGYANQTVMGTYNNNKADTLLEVGNGTGNSAKSNALEVYSNGNIIAGKDVLDADGHSLHAAGSAVESEKTASGNPVVVEDALPMNAVDLVTAINPIQSGSGTPSPTNVRPISGRSAVNVVRTGKNLLPMTLEGIKAANTDGTWSGNTYTLNGVTFTVNTDNTDNDGNITDISLNNTASADAVFNLVSNKPTYTGSYTFNGCPANGAETTYFMVIQPLNASYNPITSIVDTGAGANVSFNSSTPYMRASVRIKSGTNVSNKTFYPMLYDASIADPTFEPYKGVTLTKSLGQTVYGGTLNLTTGVGSIDRVCENASGMTWEAISNSRWKTTLANIKAYTGSVVSSVIASNYNTVSANSLYYEETGVGIASENNTIIVRNGSTTVTPDGQICYELATPIPFTVSPEVLEMLKGYNRITSDSGNLTIKYNANAVSAKADEIQVTTNIEMGTKASKAYSVNEFMLRQDGLYKVTANIASGATITTSNTTKVTITEVLTALLNA